MGAIPKTHHYTRTAGGRGRERQNRREPHAALILPLAREGRFLLARLISNGQHRDAAASSLSAPRATVKAVQSDGQQRNGRRRPNDQSTIKRVSDQSSTKHKRLEKMAKPAYKVGKCWCRTHVLGVLPSGGGGVGEQHGLIGGLTKGSYRMPPGFIHRAHAVVQAIDISVYMCCIKPVWLLKPRAKRIVPPNN